MAIFQRMKRWVLVFCLCGGEIVYGQVWLPLGEGVRPLNRLDDTYIDALAVDTINNLLYVGGDFYYAGDTVSRELAIWNGNTWNSYEKIANGHFINPVKVLLAKRDTVYYAVGDGISGFVKDTPRFQLAYPSVFGTINAMTFYHDTLYAAGDFGILKYNGRIWNNAGAQLSGLIPTHVDALCVYQDQLIMGGLFKSIGKLEVNNIAAWDGSKWHAMKNGTRYSGSIYLGGVKALAVYQGKLIASGEFDTAGTVYCQQFAQWDGKNWSPLDDNRVCSYAWQMLPHDSLLYVVGNMNLAGPDCIVNRVATWDGAVWKDLNFDFADNVFAVAFFDGQLTVGFDRSYYIDDSTIQINYIAQSNLETGALFGHTKNTSLKFYPNPLTDVVNISFPFSNTRIIISDLCGRELRSLKIRNGNSTEINIQSLQTGIYIVSLQDEEGKTVVSKELLKAH